MEYDAPENILAHLLGVDPLAPWVLFQTGLVVAAVLVWVRDRRPGLGTVQRLLDGTQPARREQ